MNQVGMSIDNGLAHFIDISQMWRSSLKTTATFRNVAQLRAASFKPLETYPRPVPSHLRSLIKQSDLLGVYGEYKLFRARPDHNVLLKGPLSDFLLNEASCEAVGAKPHDEIVWPLLYNCTRYPFSFFALNGKDEIVNIVLQEIAYRDNSKDPLPRMEILLSDPKDPFHLVGAVLGWCEHRQFERLPGVEKVLHNEVVFVPSVLRGKRVSAMLYPPTMKESVDLAPKYGLKWSVGEVTRDHNAKNMIRLGYDLPENEIAKEAYVDFDGKPWKPAENQPYARLCVLDMDMAREKKLFG